MGSRYVSILETMLARASQVQSKEPESLSLSPLQGESSAKTSELVLSVASGGGSGREGSPPNEAKSYLYNEIIPYNSIIKIKHHSSFWYNIPFFCRTTLLVCV